MFATVIGNSLETSTCRVSDWQQQGTAVVGYDSTDRPAFQCFTTRTLTEFSPRPAEFSLQLYLCYSRGAKQAGSFMHHT